MAPSTGLQKAGVRSGYTMFEAQCKITMQNGLRISRWRQIINPSTGPSEFRGLCDCTGQTSMRWLWLEWILESFMEEVAFELD